jgi:hypothetical protein
VPSRIAHHVALLNRSSAVTDDEAKKIARALQAQVSEDFSRVWGIDASLSFVPSNSMRGWQGKWNLVLLDESDQANALGYHDLTPEGLPLGKVFAATDKRYGATVSVTASHELLEMLLDPWINLVVEDTGRGVFVAYEASDAVEADELGYEQEGLLVSDFVTPDFFDPQAPHRTKPPPSYSFRGNVHRPFELAAGGYESLFVPGKGWTQNTARQHGAFASDRPRVGSRRERRRIPRAEWQRSRD